MRQALLGRPVPNDREGMRTGVETLLGRSELEGDWEEYSVTAGAFGIDEARECVTDGPVPLSMLFLLFLLLLLLLLLLL